MLVSSTQAIIRPQEHQMAAPSREARDTDLYRAVHRLSARAQRSAMTAKMKVVEADDARKVDDRRALRETMKQALDKVTDAMLSESVASDAAKRIDDPNLHTRSALALAEAHDEVEKAINAMMEIREIAVFGKHTRR
jgi:hypothetical protein